MHLPVAGCPTERMGVYLQDSVLRSAVSMGAMSCGACPMVRYCAVADTVKVMGWLPAHLAVASAM